MPRKGEEEGIGVPLSRAVSGSSNALKPLFLIVGVSFLLRLGIILLARTYHDPELWEYEDIARNILEGRGFLFPHLGREYLSMRPLFVYVCVAVYWLTGWSHLAMLVVQSLASAMLAVVIFGISRSLTTSMGALLGSALTAFHPALILYDTRKVHPLSIQALLLALVFLSLLLLLKSPTPWGFARLGFSREAIRLFVMKLFYPCRDFRARSFAFNKLFSDWEPQKSARVRREKS